jgi:CO/xanthine dehydrogenase FAD-binding subunit
MSSITGFHEPVTLADAVTLLAGSGPGATLLAGGTDLGVQVRCGLVAPTDLVSLNRIPELRRLAVADGEVTIGAGVTHRQIEQSALFDAALVGLAEACETVGAVQTRNVGTIGGNLANASPAADTPPVFMAFRATVDIVGAAGHRDVGIDDFFLDYRTTVLNAGDIVTAVRVPVPDGPAGSAFVKLGRRRAMEISISCAAAFVRLAEDHETCAEVGIGLGSVAATTIRATGGESALRGEPVTDELLHAAADAAALHCDPVDDVRATAAYRHQVTHVLVYRALRRAFDRARAGTRGTTR